LYQLCGPTRKAKGEDLAETRIFGFMGMRLCLSAQVGVFTNLLNIFIGDNFKGGNVELRGYDLSLFP
jgi:hypothetical protein